MGTSNAHAPFCVSVVFAWRSLGCAHHTTTMTTPISYLFTHRPLSSCLPSYLPLCVLHIEPTPRGLHGIAPLILHLHSHTSTVDHILLHGCSCNRRLLPGFVFVDAPHCMVWDLLIYTFFICGVLARDSGMIFGNLDL